MIIFWGLTGKLGKNDPIFGGGQNHESAQFHIFRHIFSSFFRKFDGFEEGGKMG